MEKVNNILLKLLGKGAISVKGGYQSSITAGMKPTRPVICNVSDISKWAMEQKSNNAIISNQPDVYFTKMLDMPVNFIPYRDLEKIDFESWIDEHREWFEREFPWTKKLQNILSQNGIHVDTIDLLIESGDLWRFAWPEYSQGKILVEDTKIIQGIANRYGVEVDKLVSGRVLVQAEQVSNVEALERWLSALDKNKGDVTIDSIHAATFLINTRSLVWFAVNGGHVKVEDKQQVLDLLSEQVRIASDMLGALNQVLLSNKDKSVCSDQHEECTKKVKNIIEDIKTIKVIQEKIENEFKHNLQVKERVS